MVKKYSYLRNMWKGVRILIIAGGSFLLANLQDWLPPEYATPAVMIALELIRNRLFGKHDKAIFRR